MEAVDCLSERFLQLFPELSHVRRTHSWSRSQQWMLSCFVLLQVLFTAPVSKLWEDVKLSFAERTLVGTRFCEFCSSEA